MWRWPYALILLFFMYAIEIAEWIPPKIGYIFTVITLFTIGILGRKSEE